MNCIETQRLIMPFINDELNIDQLEEFVNHINSCSNCMEELEVYYVLLAGMKQLDEDKELTINFHQELTDILKHAEERIIHEKFLHIRKRIILSVLISIVAIISSFQFGEFVVEDVLRKEVTKSNYRMDNLFITYNPSLRYYPVKANGSDSLQFEIYENLTDIYVYIRDNDKEGAKLMEDHFGDLIWDNYKALDGIGLQVSFPEWIIWAY